MFKIKKVVPLTAKVVVNESEVALFVATQV